MNIKFQYDSLKYDIKHTLYNIINDFTLTFYIRLNNVHMMLFIKNT